MIIAKSLNDRARNEIAGYGSPPLRVEKQTDGSTVVLRANGKEPSKAEQARIARRVRYYSMPTEDRKKNGKVYLKVWIPENVAFPFLVRCAELGLTKTEAITRMAKLFLEKEGPPS